MINVRLPEEKDRNLAFYLAMEEYVAGKFASGDYFFLWRTAPSVIFGRNQQMEAEVNVPYCRSHGVNIFRRKSGGGCVYSDWGNIMHSCITTSGLEPAFTFESYMQRMALLLRRLGLDASVSGRNDIMAGGYKVSGNAFHVLPRRCIIHGTLLYDVDMEALSEAITPSAEKLERKGISSVRQRVKNLHDMLDISIEELSEYLVREFCDTEVFLDREDEKKIYELASAYEDESFITGRIIHNNQ